MKTPSMKTLILTLFFRLTLPISYAEENGFGIHTHEWGKKTLTVCFASPEQSPLTTLSIQMEDDQGLSNPKQLSVWSEGLKLKIKQTITAEYSLKRTGIEFTGWNLCKPSLSKRNLEEDVALFLSSPLASNFTSDQGSSNIRNKWNSISGGIDSRTASIWFLNPLAYKMSSDRFGKNLLTNDERFQLTTLHEFGHIAGLLHEHDRLQKKDQDLNLHLLQPEIEEDFYFKLENKHPDESLLGEYDPNSIMNYIYLDTLKYITGTSWILNKSLPPLKNFSVKQKRSEFPINTLSFEDKSLWTQTQLDENRTEFKIRIGLSQGDIRALRCLNHFYPKEIEIKNCR